MKIFLTGATGYIGARLAHHFAEQGDTVNALVRTPAKASGIKHKNIHLFEGDLHKPETLKQAAQGCDAAIHTAAYSAVYTDDFSLFERINVQGTQAVHDAAVAAGIGRFIYTSSAGSLGPSINGPVSEKSEREVPFFNEYERTKHLAENFVLQQNSGKMQTSVLNLTRVFGPGLLTEANGTTRLMQQVAQGKWRIIPGNGRHVGNYVFINDVITAHHLALDNARGGEKYIIGGDNISFDDFFAVIKDKSGATQRMIHLPEPIIILSSYIMKMLAPLGVTPTITPEWARRYLYDWKMDNKKAVSELGVNFTPFEKAVQITINWLKNRHDQRN